MPQALVLRLSRSIRPRLALTCCALAALSPGVAGAASYVVGFGPGCTHETLDAAFAAATANSEADKIRIASPSVGPMTVPVEIENDYIDLRGGYPDCLASLPTGRSVVQVELKGADAFRVHGTLATQLDVHDIYLLVGDAAGRALRIEGRGRVRLYGTLLADGQAPDGGNVWMSGPDTKLQLFADSTIATGTATTGKGGGIYCEAGGRIESSGFSNVDGNQAFDSGGGLFLDGCTYLHLSDPSGTGVNGSGVANNRALYGDGGGIAAIGASRVEIRGDDVVDYAVVRANEAGGAGGGLALAEAGTVAILTHAILTENRSGEAGGGAHVGAGASLQMDAGPSRCGEFAGWSCSCLFENASGTVGGAIAVAANGSAIVKRTYIGRNYSSGGAAGAVAAVEGAGASLLIESSFLIDNDPNGAAGAESARIYGGSSATVTIAYSTIVEDATSTAGVFQVSGVSRLKLLSSIVQPYIGSSAVTFVPARPAATTADCLVVRESASLPLGSSGIHVATSSSTIFRGGTDRPYRLRSTSPAIDYCDTYYYAPTTTDFEGALRGYDVATRPNFWGPYDLGAWEWRP